MKLNSVKSSRKIEDVDSQPDQSAVILKMLVSAVLEMDARMKRMEAMLEILTLKAEKWAWYTADKESPITTLFSEMMRNNPSIKH